MMSYGMEIADGSREKLREEVRAMQTKGRQLKEQYKKEGLTVVYSHCIGTREHIAITKGAAGYAVRKNGKVVLSNSTLEECARQAYVKGYIGYYQYIKTAYGAEAEQKARKDPATQARLKKIGRNANAY